LIQDSLKTWGVPGVAVAIVHKDKVIYLQGHGFRELGKKDPVTADTLFPLASCTKAFTTAALAMLVDEGKMAWDDHVRKHLPYFKLKDPVANLGVSLRDLVSHRGGLASHDLLWYQAPWKVEEAVRRLAELAPAYPFRSGYQYQSTMVSAAGLAVASTAQMPWHEFVQKRICQPLGMTRTFFSTNPVLKQADHASPHRKLST